MTTRDHFVARLRAEYQRTGTALADLRNAGEEFAPEVLRLEAREVEIVDALRAFGIAPDVLVAA